MLGLTMWMACSAPEPVASAPEVEPTAAGPMPSSWVEERLDDARTRLSATPAGQKVWSAIEAHGGLRSWLAAGTVSFDFDYRPVNDPTARRHTHQRIDLWRSHAVHESLDVDGVRFGWNGTEAWMVPNIDAFPSPARFWSLTPYYFLGMPFVLGDPGAQFEDLGQEGLDGQPYDLVKVTYAPGTGDAPDDYYILYLHPETHRMEALRYVVSYPGFADNFGAKGRSNETLMRTTDWAEVGGLQFATTMNTFQWNEEGGGVVKPRAEVEAANIVLGETVPFEAFDPPEGAAVTTSM
jgi:hypothetical protein